MATPSSCWEKELKQQEGEVPSGLKRKVTPAPGDVQGTGNLDPGAWVPTVWSDCPLSGGGAARVGPARDSTCAVAAPGAILVIAEDPGSPSMDCVQARGGPELQGSQSPVAELRRVGPETGQSLQTAPTETTGATGQATSGAGQLCGRPAQTRSPAKGRGQKRPSGEEAAGAPKFPQISLFLGAPPPEASSTLPPSCPTAQPSRRRRRPAPQASPCDGPSLRGPALRSQAQLSAPGPALRSRAARPGPALQTRTTPPGRATRRRGAAAPGPVSHRHDAELGPALRSRTTPPGLATHRREAAPGRATRRRKATPGPASRLPAAEAGPVFRRRVPTPVAATRRRTPPPVPGTRRRAPTPVPAMQRHAPTPVPATRRRAPTPVPANLHRATSRVSAVRRHESASGSAVHSHAFRSHTALQNRASATGPASRSRATKPGPALCSRTTPLCPALHSGVTTPCFVRLCRLAQRGSSPTSQPSLPGPGDQSPPFPGSTLGRLVIPSSSGSPDPEVPSLPFQPCLHGVPMRASSPSPPGRSFSFLGQRDDSSSSFSFSTPTTFSGQSSSSELHGPGSDSTPSPASSTPASLTKLDALCTSLQRCRLI